MVPRSLTVLVTTSSRIFSASLYSPQIQRVLFSCVWTSHFIYFYSDPTLLASLVCAIIPIQAQTPSRYIWSVFFLDVARFCAEHAVAARSLPHVKNPDRDQLLFNLSKKVLIYPILISSDRYPGSNQIKHNLWG